MNGEKHARSCRRGVRCATAVSVFTACLWSTSDAKLFSTKAQEENMVSKAVEVSEKWNRYLNDAYRNDGGATEMKSLFNAAAGYGGGIFSDMAICNEMLRLRFHAQRGDEASLRAMDEFDAAAEELCTRDKERYYAAKAMLRSRATGVTGAALKTAWFSRLTNDCLRASRFGYDAKTGIACVSRFAEKNGLKALAADEAACRIRYEYAAFFLAEAESLHVRNKDEEALKTAIRGIERIPVESKLDSGACNKWRSGEAMLAAYDGLFIQPLAKCTGKYREKLIVESCKRHWKHKKLVAKLLPRILSPSPDAFDIFRKAGRDSALKSNTAIAAAEFFLWKKADKGDEFKKKYPERFRMATAKSRH